MKQRAEQKGANAIIAIDSYNTIGGEIMYIAVHGTAVRVVPEIEYEEEIIKEEKKRAEAVLKEKARLEHMKELQEKRDKGMEIQEEQFLQRIENEERVFAIWNIWKRYEFNTLYEEGTALLMEKRLLKIRLGNLQVHS